MAVFSHTVGVAVHEGSDEAVNYVGRESRVIGFCRSLQGASDQIDHVFGRFQFFSFKTSRQGRM